MRTLMLILAVVACTRNESPAPAAPPAEAPPVVVETRAPGAPVPETPAPETPAPERNITIESVEAANPLVIAGRARTFENNVVVRARDARGALIAETFTTSAGEMGNHNPYRATVWITRDPGDRITAEALEYSAKDGSERSLVAVTKPYPVERVAVTLFFPDTDCTTVRPHTRRLPKSISLARLLVEALIAGPTAQERAADAVTAFPEGSAVRSVNLRDGTLTVDFNSRLQNVGGACRAQMIRRSVTETLRALSNVRKVLITADGSESLALQP